MSLTAQATEKLRKLVESACADPKTDIPGLTVAVVGKDGNDLFVHSAGRRGIESDEPMTPENIFWIASCTKMLTGIACLQLVENDVLKLDDGTQLEGLCPELKDLPVLRNDGTAQRKNKAITLRMLLTHTAGFGYSFFNERIRNWGFPSGIDEFSGRIEDMKLPLLFQPGEGWEYGVSIDWAGIALERASGVRLNDYLLKNVLQPLDLKNINMIPTRDMRARMAYMHHRDADGKVQPRDHLQRAPIVVDINDKDAVSKVFQSGGAGMYAKPSEYTKVIAVLLNDGTCPRTGTKILQKTTVDEMFKNQVPQIPNFGRQGIPASKPGLTNPLPDLYPADNAPQGWGLTFMLANSDATGRSKSTAHWAGLANLWWWADKEKGVGGLVATQILPFADSKVLRLWAGVEAEVYKGLAQGTDETSSR